jgi:ATP-binding cassette subfamily C protein CydD
VVIAVYDVSSAVIVLIALPLIPIFMVLIGLLTRERSAASLAAMTTLQSRLLDLVAGIPTLRALGRVGGSAQRIAELGAAHRRSAMSTLRIAFLSALVLELLATLGVALVAVGVGLRLVFGDMTLAAV